MQTNIDGWIGPTHYSNLPGRRVVVSANGLSNSDSVEIEMSARVNHYCQK